MHQGVVEASGNRQHPVMWGKFDGNMAVNLMVFLVKPKLYSFVEISHRCSNNCGSQCLDINLKGKE